MMEQVNRLLVNRLESIWDEPEQDWVNKMTRDSKIKDGLLAGDDSEKVDKIFSIMANHAKSLMYIELKKLQKKVEDLKGHSH